MNEEEDFLEQMRLSGVKPLDPKKPQKATQGLSPLPVTFAPSDKAKEGPTPVKRAKSTRPKKIGRSFEPDWVLDLHGMTGAESISKVQRHLHLAHERGCTSMLLITGKGLNSKVPGGVLPVVVMDWLDLESPNFVYSVELAPSFLGGTGAILVFFSKT